MKTQVILLSASQRWSRVALLGCLLLAPLGCDDGGDGSGRAANPGAPGSGAAPGGGTTATSGAGATPSSEGAALPRRDRKNPFVKGTTKISDFAFGPNWTFAIVDLSTRKVTRELTALGFHEGSYYAPVIDGVTHLLTPQANAAGPKGTTYYALGADGATTRGLELAGWSTRAFRVH
jgi:hypothetical protein